MSRRQFPRVNASRGAPMGRGSYGSPDECCRRSVRLFRMHIDSGGYDDGGAYWGIGQPLWCARSADEDYQAMCRANTRHEAMIELGLTREQLIDTKGIT